MSEFTTDELEQLRDDIGEQLSVQGGEAAANVVPRGLLRRRVKEISEGNTQQTNKGLLGAGIGAAAGGGLGALTTGLARGSRYAPVGLLGAIPGAVAGYGIGKEREQQAQLQNLLETELGEPKEAAIRSSLEPGFEEILNELWDEKKKGVFNRDSLKGAVRDLKKGRGHSLKPSERLLLRKHILGQSKLQIADAPWLPREKVPQPKLPPVPPPPNPPWKPKPGWKPPATHKVWNTLKKNKMPFALLGGAAALGALGLGASALASKASWEKEPLTKKRKAVTQ